MAPRGRRPKPTALHRLEGTFRTTRHRGRALEPVPQGNLASMSPPDWLSDEQKLIWSDVLVEAPAGLLKRIDAQLFANYIELIDRHQKAVLAQRRIDEGAPLPFMVKGPNGNPMTSPYVYQINRTVLMMRLLQNEMGFTPAARTRIVTEPALDDEGEDYGWALLDSLRALPKR